MNTTILNAMWYIILWYIIRKSIGRTKAKIKWGLTVKVLVFLTYQILLTTGSLGNNDP